MGILYADMGQNVQRTICDALFFLRVSRARSYRSCTSSPRLRPTERTGEDLRPLFSSHIFCFTVPVVRTKYIKCPLHKDTNRRYIKTMTKKEQRRRELQQAYQTQLAACVKDSTTVTGILIARIAYLAAYLDELQEQTTKEGVVVKYDNGGGQTGIRVHPAVQVYTQYHKDLTASLKQLREFMPEDAGTDELVKFMEEHKK